MQRDVHLCANTTPVDGGTSVKETKALKFNIIFFPYDIFGYMNQKANGLPWSPGASGAVGIGGTLGHGWCTPSCQAKKFFVLCTCANPAPVKDKNTRS